jgi:hypothetical protein
MPIKAVNRLSARSGRIAQWQIELKLANQARHALPSAVNPQVKHSGANLRSQAGTVANTPPSAADSAYGRITEFEVHN